MAKQARRKHRREPTGRPTANTGGRPSSAAGNRWSRSIRSPFVLAVFTGLLFWDAIPPFQWWPLGWIAPLGLLMIVSNRTLPGRHPYWAIWAASALYWMLVMQGIRLAHWANYFGLVALGCYLGIYWPLFVAVAREAVHRWKLPLVIVAPVAWTGIEVLRGYGPLGFSMALLAHTQTNCVSVIQVSDLFGAYTVSFALMLVATCLLAMLPLERRWTLWPAAVIVLVVACILLYGRFRLNQPRPGAGGQAVRVALIQGAIDTVFEDNPDRPVEMLQQYTELTEQAVLKYPSLDLVIWPETMFPACDVVIEPGKQVQLDAGLNMPNVRSNQIAFNQLTRNGIRRINENGNLRKQTSWLLGAATWQLGDHAPYRFNSAIMIDPQGNVAGRYHKMHPVIFGEYVPFGDMFPFLYRLTPMPSGLTCGRKPLAVTTRSLTLSPSICFEDTMPHLIRQHVVQLDRQGQSPDVLVNLTNDGWFWGSSILDMQLHCAVFRAVELRRPVLVAANTGLSAWIDSSGAVRAKGPRRATATLLAEVERDGRVTGYQQWGDLPAGLCTLFCLCVVLTGLGVRIRGRGKTVSSQQ